MPRDRLASVRVTAWGAQAAPLEGDVLCRYIQCRPALEAARKARAGTRTDGGLKGGPDGCGGSGDVMMDGDEGCRMAERGGGEVRGVLGMGRGLVPKGIAAGEEAEELYRAAMLVSTCGREGGEGERADEHLRAGEHLRGREVST